MADAEGIIPLSDAERDLIRQRERTIDNLKPLFAVIFAISFGVIGNGAFAKLSGALTGETHPYPGGLVWLLNGEMLAVFAVTAGVFFHQGMKFLDVRYAKPPLSEHNAGGFAWDYLTLVGTMVPFFFMAQSFSPTITHVYGYTWFFFFYVSLIGLGLVWLLLAEVRHSPVVRDLILRETLREHELVRERVLRTYWLFMNSAMLCALLGLFAAYRASGSMCPTAATDGSFPTFVFVFGLLALIRDYLDYGFAWRLLFPMRPAQGDHAGLWPATLIRSTDQRLWRVGAYSLIAVIGIIIFKTQIWNLQFWAEQCRVG